MNFEKKVVEILKSACTFLNVQFEIDDNIENRTESSKFALDVQAS